MLRDLQSSLVVFLVALPLCLGIALASGAPLISGVISGIIGGIVVGLISGSATSVSGPAAGLTVIVASAISDIGDYQGFLVAVVLAGVFQIIFALLKLGRAGGYFPSSVIRGMLAAIGLILILKQIPHAIGLDTDYMGDSAFFQNDGANTFSEILVASQVFEIGAVIISSISLALLIFWNSMASKGVVFFKKVPGPLIVVILGVVLNEFILPESIALKAEHLVSFGGFLGMNDLGNFFTLPDFSYLTNKAVYIAAITIALIASLESLLSVEAVDKIDPERRKTPKNRELFAQGFGNTVSGLLGGIPLTSVIIRSSANVAANAETKKSAILHGVWLLALTILIPGYLEKIPLSALAAILLIIGYKLCSVGVIKSMYTRGKYIFAPFAITIVAILLTDLLVGILIGLVVGLGFVLSTSFRATLMMVKRDNYYLIRFLKDASFLQKPKLEAILNSLPANSEVAIDGSGHYFIDSDLIMMLEDFLEEAKMKKIKVDILKSPHALNHFFRP